MFTEATLTQRNLNLPKTTASLTPSESLRNELSQDAIHTVQNCNCGLQYSSVPLAERIVQISTE